MPLLSWDERNAPQYYTETYLHSGLHGFDFSALLGLCLVWKCQARKTNFRVLKKICKVVVKNRIPSSMCFRIAYIVIRVLWRQSVFGTMLSSNENISCFCCLARINFHGYWYKFHSWPQIISLLYFVYLPCIYHFVSTNLLVLWCINMITFHKWKKHFHSNRKKKNFSALPMVSYIIFPG